MLAHNERSVSSFPEHRSNFNNHAVHSLNPPFQPTPPAICIRHVEPDDCDALHVLFSEPQVIYWTIELPFMATGNRQKRMIEQPQGHYTLVACAGPALVGSLGFAVMPMPRLTHTARLGPIAVHPNSQGQGIGSKLMQAAIDLADNWLNIHRLELYVYTDNAPAIALYQKFGFEIEGTIRDMAFRAGHYADGYLMSRIARLRTSPC